jgi:hypothetical protein
MKLDKPIPWELVSIELMLLRRACAQYLPPVDSIFAFRAPAGFPSFQLISPSALHLIKDAMENNYGTR